MTDTYTTDTPAERMTLLAGSAGGTGLKTVRLAQDGEVRSKNGTFIVDSVGATLVINSFDNHGVELPVDIEHETLRGQYASPSGRAPAAGWITRLWYEAGRGLLGLVRWNDKTREMIQAGEYGYLSPVLLVRKADRRVVELHSAALTTKPAIASMQRLVASETFNEEIAMAEEPEQGGENGNENSDESAEALLIKIKEDLGLSEKMTATAILAAVLAKLNDRQGTVAASE